MSKSRKKSEPKNVLERGAVPPPAAEKAPSTALAEEDYGTPPGWKRAHDVLDAVTAVPTRFLDFNRGTRVGGLPVRRFVTVHGPTHGGKTAWVGGLLESFVSQGHIGAYIDAEHSTPIEFFEELFGRPLSQVPNFFAERPENYEETIDKVDELLKWVGDLRVGDKKNQRPDLCSIIVVDSINKLVPSRELDQFRKHGADALEKGVGRHRAALNQAWLDSLTPKLARANCAMVFIAQERQDEGLEPWEMPKIKGGKALSYDASMVVRVMKGAPVREGKGADAVVKGFMHKIRIWKSKVGHMEGNYTDAAFHMSNGKLVPEGFDSARDAVHVGRALDVIEVNGSWLAWGKYNWQGADKAVVYLHEHPEVLGALQMAINGKIAEQTNGARR